ncbi:serine threonine protein kinase [Cryptosporidium ubiquitum]|uniref:Serine threonine protein kinase n=1 Tax=Cryptosporidium ubiquitum TaxID=857276 RepID=A0A1J4MKN5_9CRYT|nr:serine threonine protein kinase [Cryptosporidium ubiquitum]OII74003.1 serine threonine protein kinase [Cryptosporidium ubiquitum]
MSLNTKNKDPERFKIGDHEMPNMDHENDNSSLESLNFVIPKGDEEKSLKDRNLERREIMRELFKVGNLIEVVYSQGACFEQRLIVFSILSILGMGAYGIVVLAEICSPGNKRSRNSITVEITDSNMKQLFEKLDQRTKETRKSSKERTGGGTVIGKKLAIKIVDLEANDSAELEDPLATARKEISIMSELQDCEQILKYYVTFASASFLYILMEYAEGGSLYGLYSKYGCFPEELLASVAQDVLKALRRLHGQDHSKSQHYILHNDIKSANILLTNNCVAKLADFGVSRKVKSDLRRNQEDSGSKVKMDSLSNDREILGSPFWMAPEIILGNSFSGLMGEPGASDIWSLGITVLELAFGRIPWPNFESLEDLLGYILRSPPPQKIVRKDVRELFSPEFWDFVDCCLTKDPSLRKSADTLLKHPFITLKAKRPGSLNIFFQTISGVQIHNSNYIQSIFNYVNHLFSSGVKVPTKYHSLTSRNFIKKISTVSISRYFSRKRSSVVQGIGNTSIKSSRNQKALENHQDPRLSISHSPTNYKDENGSPLLDKRVSMGQINRCLESPSIELGKLKLPDSSSPPPSSSPYSSFLLLHGISSLKSTPEENESEISEEISVTCSDEEKILIKASESKRKGIHDKQTKKRFGNQIHNKEIIPSEIENNTKKEVSKLKTRKFVFSCCCSKNDAN